MRIFVLGFFSLTVVIYGIDHGFSGFGGSELSPTKAAGERAESQPTAPVPTA